MNHVAGVRAPARCFVLRREGRSAALADLVERAPSTLAASLGLTRDRAVFDVSLSRLRAEESTAAILADVDMTRSAQLRGWRLRDVLLSASGAPSPRQNIREDSVGEKVRVRSGECYVGLAVTWDAKRLQVLQAIRLAIVGEQAERDNVIDGQLALGRAAMPTGVVIAETGGSSLTLPIWASGVFRRCHANILPCLAN